jgi:pyruvate/2-oxoglutarate dehydrogenase complex dihydrolipoamide dehydrogenase (E3) component
MPETLTPDICIIGAGSGGLSVAAAAAAFGVPTVLVERAAMGGECLNTGCVPSKALLAAAKRAAVARYSQAFGVKASAVDVDFAAVHQHVHDAIKSIAPMDSAERFAGLGVRVIKGHAKFKNRRTVTVGDQFDIRARRFVIATGSTPAVPPISGLDTGPYLTNETLFDLKQLPPRLIVVGAGPVGLEMAQAFRRLGSEVTVLEANEPLAMDDPEAVAIVLSQLEREGVTIKTGVKLVHVSHIAHSVAVTIEVAGRQEMVEGSHLLIAAGRKPTTDGLNLEAARIKYDALGIKVNRKLKTSNGRVYAIGDVAAGQPRFTHAANYHAGLVIRNALFRLSTRVEIAAVPRVLFTEPELAQAGLTEAQARQRRLKIRILRWPYHDNDRAQAERTTHGHIKVITDKKGKILGATIVGAQAGEMIAMWSLAVVQGMNIRAMVDLVLPYPTFSEIGKRVAVDFFAPNLTRPWVRRIIAWLRIFG